MIRPVDTINGKFLYVPGNDKVSAKMIAPGTPGSIIPVDHVERLEFRYPFPVRLDLRPLPEGLF